MISIIIPTLNEQRALPATLDQFIGVTDVNEIILSDGGSNDNTIAIARVFQQQLPHLKIITAPKGRGSQMNAGAKVATGKWLLFLHADTLIQAGGITELIKHATDHHYQAGAFTHRFSGDRWNLRLISFLHNWRFTKTGIIYGDQAMFIRRDLFKQLEGFPDAIMEDIRFSEKLVKVTRPIKLSSQVITDSRKFEQLGIWRAFYYVLLILVRYGKNRPVGCTPFFNNYR